MNTNVTKAYARAIIQLGEEGRIDVGKELTIFTEAINGSNHLENVLFLDVFTCEERKNVLKNIFIKLKLSQLVRNFIYFLIDEKRMNIFPMIFKEIIIIDDHKKGFMRGVIEGSGDFASKDAEKRILSHLKEQLGLTAKLTYKKNKNITAGYRVTVEDYQIDATLDNQLKQFKNEVLQN